MERKC